MKRGLLLCLSMLTAPAALADGFAIKDLSAVSASATAALGEGFAPRAEAKRLTFTCPTCDGQPMIDMLIGRQTDGTEQRVRSGETSIAKLEALCKERSPTCRIAALKIAPAVGWISSYPMGPMAGSTAVILRDGDLLTIRSIAGNPATARRNAERIIASVAPRIIGR